MSFMAKKKFLILNKPQQRGCIIGTQTQVTKGSSGVSQECG